MRLVTIPLLGVLALSLTVADPATARPRFGPGAILGAFASLFGGGFRHAYRHHRRGAMVRAHARMPPRAREAARQASRIKPPQVSVKPAAWAGAVFWPHAADDLIGYALFPNDAGGRFWAYADILSDVFPVRDSGAGGRGRTARQRAMQSAPQTTEPITEPPLELCGSASGPGAADGVIERIEQAVAPNDAQRALLIPLRTALVAASERIALICPTDVPGNPLQRLDTMQDRIGAIRDAAFTIRVPLENFYNSLSDAQKARLSGRTGAGSAAQAAGERRAASCGAQAAAPPDSRAIEQIIKPTPEQRASLQELQMRFAGLAQLVLSSCPSETPASPVDRLAAAGDRLTTMLFAVMNAAPALQAFYGSLSDEQKANIGKSMRPRAGERA
jgi:LTXXQ motif family protein